MVVAMLIVGTVGAGELELRVTEPVRVRTRFEPLTAKV